MSQNEFDKNHLLGYSEYAYIKWFIFNVRAHGLLLDKDG